MAILLVNPKLKSSSLEETNQVEKFDPLASGLRFEPLDTAMEMASRVIPAFMDLSEEQVTISEPLLLSGPLEQGNRLGVRYENRYLVSCLGYHHGRIARFLLIVTYYVNDKLKLELGGCCLWHMEDLDEDPKVPAACIVEDICNRLPEQLDHGLQLIEIDRSWFDHPATALESIDDTLRKAVVFVRRNR